MIVSDLHELKILDVKQEEKFLAYLDSELEARFVSSRRNFNFRSHDYTIEIEGFRYKLKFAEDRNNLSGGPPSYLVNISKKYRNEPETLLY